MASFETIRSLKSYGLNLAILVHLGKNYHLQHPYVMFSIIELVV